MKTWKKTIILVSLLTVLSGLTVSCQFEQGSDETKAAANKIANYTQEIAENPDRAELYNNRGNANFYAEKYVAAIADFSQAIKLNPQLAEAYFNRGFAYHKLVQPESALKDYNQAISLNPSYTEAYGNRGVLLLELKEYQGAIDDFTVVLESNPELAPVYSNRGLAYYQLGNPVKGKEDLQTAANIFTEQREFVGAEQVLAALAQLEAKFGK